MSAPTVASLLPPKVRAWVYALLVPANSAYLAADVVYDLPKWAPILATAVNALGFAVAFSNTTQATPEDEAYVEVDATAVQSLDVPAEDEVESEPVSLGFGAR